jgi:addiction module toxin, RelE/StbE family
MTKVEISPIARADMREIGDYISRDLRNPDAALRLIQRFRDTIKPLSKFPEMGAPLLAAGKQSVPYRYLICGSYMIFYHISDTAVMIDRVLYGRRDYMALLFGDLLEDEE